MQHYQETSARRNPTRRTEMDDLNPTEPDQLGLLAEYFDDLKRYRIPFGRYGPDNVPPAGKAIYDLPLEYLIWFKEKGGGFPKGRLGELMQFVYDVKSSSAEEIFAPLRDG